MAEPTPRTVASSFLLLSKCTYTNRSASFLLFCPYLNLEHSQILLFAVLTKKPVLPTPSDISHSRKLSRFWNPSSLNQSKGIKPCSVAGTFWTGVTFWCMSTAAASPSSTVKIIALCEDRREGTRRTQTNPWASSRVYLPRIYKCDPVRILTKEIKTTKQ